MKNWLNPRSIFGITLITVALLAACLLSPRWAVRPGCASSNFAILYVFLALGLNIVVGFAGLLDLGYIAFYAVGAYVYALLASPHFGLHLPFWVILPIGAMVACIFGVLLGSPTLKLRGDYLAIVTLGFGEIVRIFMNNLNAPINITNGPQGITLIDPVAIGASSSPARRRFSAIPEWTAEVLLSAGRAGHPGHHHQPAPAAFAGWPRLAGDSRG
jgi:branched-chain amino acid transport system permease protein